MTKLIFKCICMVALFIGISNYGVYLVTGKKPQLSSFLPNFSADSQTLGKLTPSLDNMNPDIDGATVYKWVDENGTTQYSSDPPPPKISVQTLTLDQNTNIVKAIELPTPEQNSKTDNQSTSSSLAVPTGSLYSPGGIKKVMDDAKNVQNLLDEQFKKQQEMLEDQ